MSDQPPPPDGAGYLSAMAHGTQAEHVIAVDVLAALAGYMRSIGHEVDGYGATHPDGRSWWIRFRRRDAT